MLKKLVRLLAPLHHHPLKMCTKLNHIAKKSKIKFLSKSKRLKSSRNKNCPKLTLNFFSKQSNFTTKFYRL